MSYKSVFNCSQSSTSQCLSCGPDCVCPAGSSDSLCHSSAQDRSDLWHVSCSSPNRTVCLRHTHSGTRPKCMYDNMVCTVALLQNSSNFWGIRLKLWSLRLYWNIFICETCREITTRWWQQGFGVGRRSGVGVMESEVFRWSRSRDLRWSRNQKWIW